MLNFDHKWMLYRALVCNALSLSGYHGDAWEFSGDLDMSFEELHEAGATTQEMEEQIAVDLEEYKLENPLQFCE